MGLVLVGGYGFAKVVDGCFLCIFYVKCASRMGRVKLKGYLKMR